jgi:hypothetical protein
MLRRMMRCSFCRRRDSEVAKLVAGPWRILAGRVYICDRCAAQTIRIMESHTGDDQPRGATESLIRRALNRLGRSRHRETPGRSARFDFCLRYGRGAKELSWVPAGRDSSNG